MVPFFVVAIGTSDWCFGYTSGSKTTKDEYVAVCPTILFRTKLYRKSSERESSDPFLSNIIEVNKFDPRTALRVDSSRTE
jgi:hypothetical protein